MRKLSNTSQRILSALFIVSLLCFVLFIGGPTLEYFVIVVSLILLDELLRNFLRIRRMTPYYIGGQLSFLFLSFYMTNNLNPHELYQVVVGTGIPLALGVFGFLINPIAFRQIFFLLNIKVVKAIIALFAVTSFWAGMTVILKSELWVSHLLVLFITTYATDSFAWLVGKNFGKTPLWPAVSPKKTREGAVGGFIGGALLGTILWLIFVEASWSNSIIGIILLPVIAQLGDLAQSRIKRWVGIKDSSNLIPGHGGVFDRVDSLMLVTPFYILIVWGSYVK